LTFDPNVAMPAALIILVVIGGSRHDFQRWLRGRPHAEPIARAPVSPGPEAEHRRLGRSLVARLPVVLGAAMAAIGSMKGSPPVLRAAGVDLVLLGAAIIGVAGLRILFREAASRTVIESEEDRDPKLRQLRANARLNAAATEAYAQYLQQLIESLRVQNNLALSDHAREALPMLERQRLRAYETQLRAARRRLGAA